MKSLLQFAASTFLAACLAGCATSTLTQVESKQYADLSLVDFLKTRFQDRQSVAVKNTVRYQAYFNDVNFMQLERPTVELRNFCQAGAGKMSRTQAHSGDPVGKYFTKPVQTARPRSPYENSSGRLDLTEEIPEHAAVVNALRTRLRNEQLNVNVDYGKTEAQKVYATVRDKGTFGTWECEYYQAGRKSWRVDVVPIAYAPPGDPGNLLTNHRMIIEVTPYQQ